MAAIGEKIATREAYGSALAEFGAKYKDVIVLDADLAEATKTGKFKKEFPDRFFDCGIAEGNMVAVAAGIATTGKFRFVVLSQCLRQAVHLSRYETRLDIRILM